MKSETYLLITFYFAIMNVLEIMASEKLKAINQIINNQLGHNHTADERKLFIIEHNLQEVKISYLGEPIAKLIVPAPVDAWPQEFVDDSTDIQRIA